MAKFYVESGNLQLTVHASDSRGAAIWGVHRAMSQMLPFLSEEKRQLISALREPVQLGSTIAVNEQGFGRHDSLIYDTFSVVTEWNRLVNALERMQNELEQELTAV